MIGSGGAADPRERTAVEMERAGLLTVAAGARISRCAVFLPVDPAGVSRRVVVGAGVEVEAFATVHGGVTLGDGARVEAHAVVGRPECGYAVGRVRPAVGAPTTVGATAVVRAGAIVYAGVRVGRGSVVGHGCVVRTAVRIGDDTQLGHMITIERGTTIGDRVRCSPGSHLTGSCRLADGVFLGAGIRTVNDRLLVWRDPLRRPMLTPPRFAEGARVGSGSIVLSGVVVGQRALVGAGSLLTRDVPAGMLAHGVPARVRGIAP